METTHVWCVPALHSLQDEFLPAAGVVLKSSVLPVATLP